MYECMYESDKSKKISSGFRYEWRSNAKKPRWTQAPWRYAQQCPVTETQIALLKIQ